MPDAKKTPTLLRSIFAGLRRAGRMLLLGLMVLAALLTFPSAVPWMIAFWLLWYSVDALRGRRGWLPLVLGAGVVLIKWVPWTPPLTILAVVAVAVVLMRSLANQMDEPKWARTLDWMGLAVLWSAWGAMAYDWHRAAHADHSVALVADRPVVCIGDSLTAMGSPKRGYPEHLAQKLRVPVINLGEPGATTAQAEAKLGPVKAAHPQIVILALGGNDYVQESGRRAPLSPWEQLTAFVQGSGRQQVRENLARLIEACLGMGAEVVLVEIPRGYVVDEFSGVERELAREYDLELIPDTMIRRMLLSSPMMPPGSWTGGPYLTEDDGLHPNGAGNAFLAEQVAAALERLYGPAIRRPQGEE